MSITKNNDDFPWDEIIQEDVNENSQRTNLFNALIGLRIEMLLLDIRKRDLNMASRIC